MNSALIQVRKAFSFLAGWEEEDGQGKTTVRGRKGSLKLELEGIVAKLGKQGWWGVCKGMRREGAGMAGG